MWDLAEDPRSIALIEAFYSSGKPVAAVCHAPSVLHRVTFQGQPIVKGKRVTGFTNGEEAAVHLTKVVPFLAAAQWPQIRPIYGAQDSTVPVRNGGMPDAPDGEHSTQAGTLIEGAAGAVGAPGALPEDP